MALKKDGTVTGWGVRQLPAGLSNIVAIAAGGGFYAPSLALKRDGTVLQWTTGGFEPVPSWLSNVVSIAAGEAHSLALRNRWHRGWVGREPVRRSHRRPNNGLSLHVQWRRFHQGAGSE